MLIHTDRPHAEPSSGPVRARFRPAAGRWLTLAWLAAGAAGAANLTGCALFMDELTWQERLNPFYASPSPFVVLHDSNDGDKRARALKSLQEPKEHGGTDKDQDEVLKILASASTTERQPICRLAAIRTLGRFKDPRAADALIAAYHQAASSAPADAPVQTALAQSSGFTPEMVTVIRSQCLAGLGQSKTPAGLSLLLLVLKEPKADSTEQEKQQETDLRIVAARALRSYPAGQAAEALVSVLQTEKDVALRDRATESLHAMTGKDLPADAHAWQEYLAQAKDPKSGEISPVKQAGWFSLGH